MQPAERPAERQPLVQISQQHDRLRPVTIAHDGEDPEHLVAPLAGREAEVRDDDPRRQACNLEIDVERAARLAPREAQVVAPHIQHSAPREESVSVVAEVPDDAQPRNAGHTRGACEVVELPRCGRRSRAVVDFLQAERVAINLADDLRDALGIATPVATHAAVDVVRTDPQDLRALRAR